MFLKPLKPLLLALSLTFAVSAHAQTAVISTSQGNMTVELNTTAAPKTVANFVRYAKEGFYNNTIFHRVINNFMIQGGGFTRDMIEKTPTYAPINNEANNGLKNDKYTIAMARTSNPHSATSQFFINVKSNDFLNHTAQTNQGWGYTVFGKVTKGFEVADKIKSSYTKSVNGQDDVPIKPIVINSITIKP